MPPNQISHIHQNLSGQHYRLDHYQSPDYHHGQNEQKIKSTEIIQMIIWYGSTCPHIQMVLPAPKVRTEQKSKQ